jgi:hypothetical protein
MYLVQQEVSQVIDPQNSISFPNIYAIQAVLMSQIKPPLILDQMNLAAAAGHCASRSLTNITI